MQFNIVILGIINNKKFFISNLLFIFRQSEVIARDTRRMKYIFVVKNGSFMIWKRLDPDGHIPKLSKHDFDQKEDEKSL